MTRFLRKWWGGGAVALALMVAVLALLQARKAKSMADPEPARKTYNSIPVRTALVSQGQADEVVGATCITFPYETANIEIGASRTLKTGEPVSDIYIKSLHVRDGSAVRKGDILFTLQDEIFRQVLKQAQALLAYTRLDLERVKQQAFYNAQLRKLEVESAQANLDYRQEDLEIRKTEYTQLKKLGEKGQAASMFEIYEALHRYAEARFEKTEAVRLLERAKDAEIIGKLKDEQNIAKAINDVEKATLDVFVRERDIERCKIRSPVDGFVNTVTLVPGQEVGVMQTLFQVMRLDPILVRLDYPQNRIDDLKVGQRTDVVLDCYPQETFTGKVIRILPLANAPLRVLPVEVQLSNPGCRIKAGLNGYARVHAPKKQILTVPATAVLDLENKKVVFRVEEGRARMREVRTGSVVENGVVEITGGLAAGDEVVVYQDFYPNARNLTKGQGYLQDGDLVDANWRKWARRE